MVQMNIVVIGGSTPGKFGNDVVRRARSQGHRVLILSHRSRPNSIDTVVANFTSVESTVESFKQLIDQIDHIDLLLYNTSFDSWPNSPEHFQTGAVISEKLYVHGIKVHVIIPHAIVLEAMNYMNDGSRIVFMATDIAYCKHREKYIDRVGYVGGKSYQHQLMLALAEFNNKNITVSSISPFFNYNDTVGYNTVFEKAYGYLLTHDKESNGLVFDCWD